MLLRTKVIKSLINNAHEFIERAVQDLETSTKFSLIQFCSAMELLLKARLVAEHWTLIVTDKAINTINEQKFLKGNFKSITIDEILKRIRNILQHKLSDGEVETISNVFGHRNKVIHFYHNELEHNKEKVQIIKDICRFWRIMYNLMSNNEPNKEFSRYHYNFEKMNNEMKRYSSYLDVIYEQKKDEIGQMAKNGYTIQECLTCHHNSLINEKKIAILIFFKCLVCDDTNLVVECPCPKCGRLNTIEPYEDNYCLSCEYSYSNEDIIEKFEPIFEYDYKTGPTYASCIECSEAGTVVKIENEYFCTNCHLISHEIYNCGCCGELINEEVEFSSLNGCEFCDGRYDLLTKD